MKVFCTITAKNGERVPLTVNNDITPTQLRSEVSQATKIPLDQLRLIFRGRMIKDDDAVQAVSTFKLEEECVLHCMGKPSEAGAAPAAAAAPVAAPASSVAASVPTLVPNAAAAAPVSADPLQEAIRILRTSNTPQVYSTAISTLAKVLNNITSHPMEEKYRKVKVQNAAFRSRLGGVRGGEDAMKAVGFVIEQQDGESVYQLHASADAWPKLTAAKATVDTAAQAAKRALNPPALNPLATTTGSNNTNMFGGSNNAMMPPLGNFQSNPAVEAAMRDPRMQEMMRGVMSNPEALQQMLTNPMVQQMIQNDPNVPPHVREGMQRLVQNPEMLQQMISMTQNPIVRARMEQAMMGGDGMPPPPANMQELMNNPQAIQEMLSNPMFQQMVQNDPNVPPHVREGMQHLAQNPEMLQQVAAMAQNPAVRAQMEQAMAAQGLTPPTGGFALPSTSSTPTNRSNTGSGNNASNANNTGNNNGSTDQDQTEEEMIAEAIRRSLQER
eukprot:Nitzschia sp. Nitz4//scaffold88_size82704//62508//64147//NITZ4_005303-RA/size82704-augustus-gene-0.85-mRNA-1//-1//CDS//3329559527//8726//frame0